ncbi:MAG: hypothetical protein VYD86_10055 [Verrucomicrobiota bacterium]|nr:hypothetical protein [Verrucomicrobiota bacterium]
MHVGAVIAASTRHRIAILPIAMLWAFAWQSAGPTHIELAKRLAKAHLVGNALPQLSAIRPDATLADAYDVQKRFVDKVAKTHQGIAGYKGAVAGEAGQKALKLNGPLSAVLFRDGWLEAAVKPAIRLAKFPGTKIETEVGFVIGKAIIRPINDVDALKAHVEAIVPVIELPAGKLEPTQPMVALDLAAANVLSANYIVGRRNPVAKVNLNRATIRLARRLAKGDEEKNKTTGAAAHRGQWQNLLHQVNHALGQGREIQPGHLILTGALGKITLAEPGDWTADFGELGKIEFSIH